MNWLLLPNLVCADASCDIPHSGGCSELASHLGKSPFLSHTRSLVVEVGKDFASEEGIEEMKVGLQHRRCSAQDVVGYTQCLVKVWQA